jgi:RNA polymerase sigma-70 factor, ECF subfamily
MQHADAETVWQAGRAAWPSVDLPLGNLRSFVDERRPLPHLAADVYLACACAAHIPFAMEAFEESAGPVVDATVRRATRDASQWDDLGQGVREHLFVTGKIAQYSGQAPLGQWLRVVALRVVRSVQRKRVDTPTDEAIFRGVVEARTAEDAVIEAGLLHTYKLAFEKAFGELAPRPRTLLRLYVVEGLNVDQVARLMGVHKATAARWIASAREELAASTRAIVNQTAHLSPDEVESAIRLIQSKIELSLSRLLRDGTHGE